MRLFHSATIFCCYICTCICCLKLHQADYQVGEGFFPQFWWGALTSNVFTICVVYWSLGRRGYFGVSNVVLVMVQPWYWPSSPLNITVSAPEGLTIPPINHTTPTIRLNLVFLSYSDASFTAEITCPCTRSGYGYVITSIWNNEMWLLILNKTMDAIAYSCPNSKHFNSSTYSAAEYMHQGTG